MDRLETRELEQFLAVADELHFSHAATRLGVAQPALSKTIARLERRLGVCLFERTSRAVTLTPAGQVLAREARQVLDAVSAAALRTQRAGGVEPRLILAIKAGGDGGLLPAVLAAYEREPQSVPVQLLFHADRAQMLRAGRADAALLYSPFEDMSGFDTQPLLTEPAVAVMPASHRLAGRTGLRMTDLRDENVHRKPEDAQAGGISELMHRIALEEKVAVLPRSLTMPLRDDLASVPMVDEPPITLMLAWPAQSTSPAVAALARAAERAASVPTNGEV